LGEVADAIAVITRENAKLQVESVKLQESVVSLTDVQAANQTLQHSSAQAVTQQVSDFGSSMKEWLVDSRQMQEQWMGTRIQQAEGTERPVIIHSQELARAFL
jgi:hypothetical protein